MVLGNLDRAQRAARHRNSVFGPHIAEYLAVLEGQGHPPGVVRHHRNMITNFGEFMAARGVCRLAEVGQDHLIGFLRYERARRSRHSIAKNKIVVPSRLLGAFLSHLEHRGQWHRLTKGPPSVVEGFYRSLEVERGLRPATVRNYKLFVSKFLANIGSDGSVASLARISAKHVDSFLVFAGRSYARRSMGFIGSAIRGFLRHLFREPRFYALERLPCALPWATVRRILDVPDRASRSGLRDRAIFAVLLAYGVRPSEVVALRLDDIDWRRNMVRFRRSKGGRPLSFPLTREVGEAIISYLRRGRPHTSGREVFVRCLAPYTRLYGCNISQLVSHALPKAGIISRRRGAGIIRHSLAVHLLRRGHPLKTITDILGHRDPGVVYHYTKLATEDLRDVALDARGVLP
jgi:integrase/recombinase XerD